MSVSTLFLVHGLVYATWVSRIPAVQAVLKLSPGTLGIALAGLGLGSLISMPLTGWLIARYGSKPICSFSSIAFSLALVLPGVAQSAIGLGLALTVFGAAAGSMDVSMNDRVLNWSAGSACQLYHHSMRCSASAEWRDRLSAPGWQLAPSVL